MIAALSVALLFLTGAFPSASLALPAVAGVLLVAVVLESGAKWAFLIYAAVCVLSVLLTPSKDAAFYYVVFFGYYPILKKFIESLRSRWLQWLLKLAAANVCAAVAAAVSIQLFGLQLPWSQPLFLAGIWALVNVVFVVYDVAVTQLIIFYVRQLRRVFRFK